MNAPAVSAERWWVEVIDESGRLVTRAALTGSTFRIGRGYDNDVVVDDPYVSPAHLRLSRDEAGQWWIEDAGSDNGTTNVAGEALAGRTPLSGAAQFSIGRSRVRIASGATPVPPAIKLAEAPLPSIGPLHHPQAAHFPHLPHLSDLPPAIAGLTAQAIGLMLAVAAVSALSIYLKQTGEPKFTNYIFGAILVPMIGLAWAGGWALVTRIVTAHAQFFRHVRIIACVLLITALIESAFKVLDYAFALVNANVAENTLMWLVLGGLIGAHLRVIAPRHAFRIAGIVGALALGAIALDTSMRQERQRTQPASIVPSLLPSWVPTKPPVSREALFDSIGKLKPELDEERKKDPPPFGAAGDVE